MLVTQLSHTKVAEAVKMTKSCIRRRYMWARGGKCNWWSLLDSNSDYCDHYSRNFYSFLFPRTLQSSFMIQVKSMNLGHSSELSYFTMTSICSGVVLISM